MAFIRTLMIQLLVITVIACQKREHSSLNTERVDGATRGTIVKGFNWFQSVGLIAKGKLFCSGVLLDARTVLTAAHCFIDFWSGAKKKVEDIEVFLGPYPDESGISMRAKPYRLEIHPDYDTKYEYNDLAKLYFERDLPMSQDLVDKYPFPQLVTADGLQKLSSEAKLQVNFIGYGLDNFESTSSSKREMSGPLGIVVNFGHGKMSEYLAVPTHQSYICPGDSGCPAFVHHKGTNPELLGITHARLLPRENSRYGYPDDSKVALLTPVAPYACWIKARPSSNSPRINAGNCENEQGAWKQAMRAPTVQDGKSHCVESMSLSHRTPLQTQSKVCYRAILPVTSIISKPVLPVRNCIKY